MTNVFGLITEIISNNLKARLRQQFINNKFENYEVIMEGVIVRLENVRQYLTYK